MNVVYLIGNGFDIKLGLKTRYPDFYSYYFKSPNSNLKIESFKKTLQQDTKNSELWSDLELDFGEYLSNLSSSEDFDDLFFDIKNELATTCC